MEFRQLRYFAVLAEELHFGRAAARLGIAQPALSQQIQRLEREMGYPLVNRSSRRVSLSEAGAAFLERATLSLSMADQAVLAGRSVAEGDTGHVAAGFIASSALDVLPLVLRSYLERHPHVRLDVHELSSEAQLAALQEGRLDIGLIRQLPVAEPIELTPVRDVPLMLALPGTHPLAQLEVVPLAALADVGFIVRPRSSDFFGYSNLVQYCARAGFTPRIVLEAPTTLTALGMV